MPREQRILERENEVKIATIKILFFTILVILSDYLHPIGTKENHHEELKCTFNKHANKKHANTPAPDIQQSHHDFSNSYWSVPQLCYPCHLPHDVNTSSIAASPLWNQKQSATNYEAYSSSTANNALGQASGSTKLCLSCHDGTLAGEKHTGHDTENMQSAHGNVRTDLQSDHKVSIEYNIGITEFDGGLNNPNTTPSGLGGTIMSDMLENGTVQCISCHDPHISRNSQGCAGCHGTFQGKAKSLSLLIDNSKSALCLTCHKK